MPAYEYTTAVITHGLMGRKSDEVDREELQRSSTRTAPRAGSSTSSCSTPAFHGEKDGHLLIFKRRRLRLLVLGGTVFLGRHVAAEEALARGHELTLFTRGIHGAELFPEAERIRGDRSKDVSALRDRLFDAVIDTSGYKPADVAASAGAVDAHYVFVSSCNAYPGWPAEVVDEDSPDGRAAGRRSTGRTRSAASARPRRRCRAGRGRARGLIVGPARRRLPAAVVGAPDRAGRRRAGAGRPAAASCRSSTPATSPPGCSISPSGRSRASSTAPGRPG